DQLLDERVPAQAKQQIEVPGDGLPETLGSMRGGGAVLVEVWPEDRPSFEAREKMIGQDDVLGMGQQQHIGEATPHSRNGWGGQDQVAEMVGLEDAYPHAVFLSGAASRAWQSDTGAARRRSRACSFIRAWTMALVLSSCSSRSNIVAKSR